MNPNLLEIVHATAYASAVAGGHTHKQAVRTADGAESGYKKTHYGECAVQEIEARRRLPGRQGVR